MESNNILSLKVTTSPEYEKMESPAGISNFHVCIRKFIDTEYSSIVYNLINMLPADVYSNFLINVYE